MSLGLTDSSVFLIFLYFYFHLEFTYSQWFLFPPITYIMSDDAVSNPSTPCHESLIGIPSVLCAVSTALSSSEGLRQAD